MQIFDDVSVSIPTKNKRYMMATLDRTLELLIYSRFLFPEVSRVASFNNLLVSANWRNKGKSKAKKDISTQMRFLQRCFFVSYEKLACGLGEWRRESHDDFWFIHDNHDNQIKYRCYEVEMEYRVPIVRESN